MINLNKLAAIARTKPKAVPALSANSDEEKLSRRAALRRIGMTGGIAVLGLLTIDDLARVTAKKLDQNALTHGIAKDFKNAGVAFAGPSARSLCDTGCGNQRDTDVSDCGSYPTYNILFSPLVYAAQVAAWEWCNTKADIDRQACLLRCASVL